MVEASETQLGSSVILRSAGRIDLSNAESFKERLLACLATAKTALVVDLSRVEYVSSAGLRSLMIVSKAAKPQGVELAVAALSPVVREIFTISRFDLVVPCFGSVRDAVEKLDAAALAQFDADGGFQ